MRAWVVFVEVKLHRWRVGLRPPNRLRDEPGPADWVMEAYEAL